MSDRLPRLRRLRSTTQLLRAAATSFNSNLIAFLLLSLLLLSFRVVVENGANLVTAFIDHDPSLNALFARLDRASDHKRTRSLEDSSSASPMSGRRRRPFLHLTRVGTLDDDFFSGDGDDDRSFFGAKTNFSPNRSFVIFTRFDSMIGFSDSVVDNGVRISEVVRPGVAFEADMASFAVDNDSVKDQEEENRALDKENGIGHRDIDTVVDFQFFMKGLELDHREVVVLFFLVSFLTAAYGWVILSFTVTYSMVLGMTFMSVVNELTGRFSALVGIIWDGSRLGVKRLSGFIIMRWAVRDALTQLLGLWYFGEIESQYSFFKLFVRLKLMPFSIMSPWIRGFEKEISGFLITWYLMDTLLSLVFSVDACVVIAYPRRSGRQIVKEGCYLLSIMFHPAIQLKCLEAILCGSLVRWVLAQVLGKYVAMVIQSVVEVYFMVAWLMFYFSARCRDAHLQGKRFGQRELEGMMDGLR